MGSSKWHDIWEKRQDEFSSIDMNNHMDVFAELKRINGFDVVGELPISSLIKQYEKTKQSLKIHAGQSLFEVGCGCGANLYMFLNDGIQIGGMDYSHKLISILKHVIPENNLLECYCDEAINLSTEMMYDSILSNSVFSYFPDEVYAGTVLNKMLKKARHSIGILDIHDLEKKDDFLKFRIEHTPNYKEKYKDLSKLFYSKDFFSTFAEEHDLQVVFEESTMEGYWNNNYIFNCFMYL